MSVYLFTYHAYGTWLPDKPKGYVRRKQGVLPRDSDAADRYRSQMNAPPAVFNDKVQRVIIDAVQSTAEHLDVQFRMIATDPSHIHVLLLWAHEKPWDKLRASIKIKLSIVLKAFEERPWLSDGASRKQVKDDEHLHYLEYEYLPRHRGWKWCHRRGWFK